ncbi:hypothetical protein [Nocardia rhamnosiphila]|uniref:Uncharacterized protein n=1 Tax=Nocardia rhamnosiphila TaxID=426716 RepID=A0ABV2WIU1_9NOCA
MLELTGHYGVIAAGLVEGGLVGQQYESVPVRVEDFCRCIRAATASSRSSGVPNAWAYHGTLDQPGLYRAKASIS